jgi:enoyl-CoA hydratase/carnithine racemase
MSSALVTQLIETIQRMDADDTIGAIILSGAGRGFCAGSDLVALAAMDDAARTAFEADSGRVARLLAQISKPVIAAVHGFAIGGRADAGDVL